MAAPSLDALYSTGTDDSGGAVDGEPLAVPPAAAPPPHEVSAVAPRVVHVPLAHVAVPPPPPEQKPEPEPPQPEPEPLLQPPPPQQDWLLILPWELLVMVLRRCTADSLALFSGTGRRWRRVSVQLADKWMEEAWAVAKGDAAKEQRSILIAGASTVHALSRLCGRMPSPAPHFVVRVLAEMHRFRAKYLNEPQFVEPVLADMQTAWPQPRNIQITPAALELLVLVFYENFPPQSIFFGNMIDAAWGHWSQKLGAEVYQLPKWSAEVMEEVRQRVWMAPELREFVWLCSWHALHTCRETRTWPGEPVVLTLRDVRHTLGVVGRASPRTSMRRTRRLFNLDARVPSWRLFDQDDESDDPSWRVPPHLRGYSALDAFRGVGYVH